MGLFTSALVTLSLLHPVAAHKHSVHKPAATKKEQPVRCLPAQEFIEGLEKLYFVKIFKGTNPDGSMTLIMARMTEDHIFVVLRVMAVKDSVIACPIANGFKFEPFGTEA
jgi:hypothetical protein